MFSSIVHALVKPTASLSMMGKFIIIKVETLYFQVFIKDFKFFKFAVINTVAISHLIYLTIVIHVSRQVITKIKEIIVYFLWDGKPPKIAFNVFIQNTKNGGIQLIDFGTKIKALKLDLWNVC